MNAKKKKYEMDMCSGPVLRKILIFALPLMASSILQLLFNAADIIVVGRFAGDNSLAAVGSTSSLINLLTNLFIGLSVGANVLTARYYGARKSVPLSKTIHTAMLLSILSGVFLTFVGLFGARVILELMQSPEEVLTKAALYLRIYFLGMPAMMVYNFGAAILRAVGDTRRPLYYLALAGVVNVGLNLIFVIFLKMDVAGVAAATAISQFLSAGLIIRCMTREKGSMRLRFGLLRIHKQELVKIMQIGIPAGFSGVLFSLSNVVIQSSVNTFGNIVVAGNSAAQNIEGFVYFSMNAFHQAAISFCGQNVGAGKFDRVHKGVKQGTIIGLAFSATITGILLLFGRYLFDIFTDTQELIELANRMMRIMAVGYICVSVTQVLGGVMRGAGDTTTPMWVSMISTIAIRVPVAYGLAYLTRTPEFPHGQPIALFGSLMISWTLGMVISIIVFSIGRWKKKMMA